MLAAAIGAATLLTAAVLPASPAHAIDEGFARGDDAAIARLYRAYFRRTPDANGLRYWMVQHETSHVRLAHVSDLFATSPEFLSDYGNLDTAGFVRRVYLNVLGREPDPDGYSYWAHQVAYNGVTRGQLMLLFAESAEFVADSRIIGSDRTTPAFTGELRPGNYVALVTDSCYYERLRGLDRRFENIIDNEFVPGNGPVYVTIDPTDVAFYSSRCGPWVPV
jgi:hypothetical protein